MYGFGSKKALLEDFVSSTLVDGAAVVVNGYLPSVNTKSVSNDTPYLIICKFSGGE